MADLANTNQQRQVPAQAQNWEMRQRDADSYIPMHFGKAQQLVEDLRRKGVSEEALDDVSEQISEVKEYLRKGKLKDAARNMKQLGEELTELNEKRPGTLNAEQANHVSRMTADMEMAETQLKDYRSGGGSFMLNVYVSRGPVIGVPGYPDYDPHVWLSPPPVIVVPPPVCHLGPAVVPGVGVGVGVSHREGPYGGTDVHVGTGVLGRFGLDVNVFHQNGPGGGTAVDVGGGIFGRIGRAIRVPSFGRGSPSGHPHHPPVHHGEPHHENPGHGSSPGRRNDGHPSHGHDARNAPRPEPRRDPRHSERDVSRDRQPPREPKEKR